jgi:hypothetical protein
MPTSTKKDEAAKRSEAAKKAARTKAKKAKPVEKGDAPPKPFDDLHTARDDQATPGHFVEVVSGPQKGRYGVLIGQDQYSDNVIVRTRDADSERILVKYGDLEPSEAGKR